MRENGVYLGYGDLALLAGKHEAEVWCLQWLEGSSADLKSLWGDLRQLKGMNRHTTQGQKPNLQSASTWVIAWVRADYKMGENAYDLNHTLPLFSRDQLGEEFEQVTAALLDKEHRRLTRLQKQLEICDETEDPHLVLSIRDHIELSKSKSAFFREMVARGLAPMDVPADGNCTLWSVACFLAGCFDAKLGQKDQVASLRQEHFGCGKGGNIIDHT